VFQYCLIRVLFTIVAVITQLFNVYCESSLSPAFAHIWVQVFEAASVTIAMFCLIQFYIQLKGDLAEHKPFLKVLCIKLVIFFSFWQRVRRCFHPTVHEHMLTKAQIVISFLSSTNGPLQPTKTLAYPDIKVGIPSVLLCIEMAIFAVMHIFAFPWKPYSLKHSYKDPLNVPGTGYSGGESGEMKYKGVLYALADAFNPWDIVKMTARGLRWLFVGIRKRHDDMSYQTAAKSGGIDVAMDYRGPTYAGTGEAATELRGGMASDVGRGRSGTLAEDDRAGLLGHEARMGRMPSASPYRTYSEDEYAPPANSYPRANPTQHKPRLPPRRPAPGTATGGGGYEYGDMKSSGFRSSDEDDVSSSRPYHPGYGPASSAPAAAGAGAGAQGIAGGLHPAFRMSAEQQGPPPEPEWDVFGGTGRVEQGYQPYGGAYGAGQPSGYPPGR